MNPVRMAMIGGGPGSFMGPVHRRASALDGGLRVVAGAFSRDPARNHAAGQDGERVYPDAMALIAAEAALPATERAELVAILTPNDSHADIALAAVEAGFAVLCEKPLAHDLAAARRVAAAVQAQTKPFAVAYTYLGYAMVHEIKARVAAGAIGPVRRVAANYIQGWLAQPVEKEQAGAAWRTDPACAGISGCFGDIGVHAQSLVEFTTGQPIARVMADIRTCVAGRALDDDGAVLFRLESGAAGVLTASQVCTGRQNGLDITLYGETGSLQWAQERPFELWQTDADGRVTLITANPSMLICPVAKGLLRLPGGHPEGYLEALANIYRGLVDRIRNRDDGTAMPLPSAFMGLRSLAFTQAVVASSAARGWIDVED
ncbi:MULTISPECIES: Gfo/Idh/MocA family protein [unclassified Azospirillum]|uniref:Gfo/Idh/MocA family protein n=1 Tax=unclassified Azospirillum TaxID=2630922 RepID=UPI000B75BC46|nr:MULTISPECIES: Gfo/Idh/MocA family oxidoreductase [unclassified Azospirillum]SNS67256.1 Predicted dehydrogenase [Azospirillum sp. RU38E]SNS85499.1 Predicted dehydrogenase [Azospirillum sp. RU37A]